MIYRDTTSNFQVLDRAKFLMDEVKYKISALATDKKFTDFVSDIKDKGTQAADKNKNK